MLVKMKYVGCQVERSFSVQVPVLEHDTGVQLVTPGNTCVL